MKLRLSLALLCVVLSTDVAVAQRAATTAKPAEGTKPDKVMLWQVRSETASVFLLGSVHVASRSMYPLDARMERAFASSDALVLETPLDAGAQQRAAALMQRAGLYAPPDSLDKHLDANTLAQLEKALHALGLPLQAVLPMKPWLASLTLTMLKLQTLGYQADLGIDRHFHELAGDKRVGALETIEQQVALFGEMPEATQIAALKSALAQLHELPDLMKRTVEAWRRGDAAAIDALLLEPTRRQFPELHRRLLLDRNRRIAETIESYLRGKGTTFVVVGSGHLVGKGSILRLLEARGRKPTQL